MTPRPTRHYSPDPDDPVFFYRGWFSSFFFGRYVIDVDPRWPEADVLPPVLDVDYAELPFQAAKGRTDDQAEWVLQEGIPREKRRPAEARRRGNRVPLRADWEEIKYDVMFHMTLPKFQQIEVCRGLLLRTGDRLIAEDAPRDYVWGIRDRHGGFGGQNLLGKVLMQVREELRAAE